MSTLYKGKGHAVECGSIPRYQIAGTLWWRSWRGLL